MNVVSLITFITALFFSRNIIRFLIILLILPFIFPLSFQLVAQAATQIPYCSVGMKNAPGKMRTLWDGGTVKETCAAAKSWLAEENVDWIASGEFDPDAENEVEVRCVEKDLLYKKTFHGRGSEPFEKALFHPSLNSLSCIIVKVGDNVEIVGENIPLRDTFQFSVEEQKHIHELNEALKNESPWVTEEDFPTFKINLERKSLIFHAPQMLNVKGRQFEKEEAGKGDIIEGFEPDSRENNVDLLSESSENKNFHGEMVNIAVDPQNLPKNNVHNKALPTTGASDIINNKSNKVHGKKNEIAIEYGHEAKLTQQLNGHAIAFVKGYVLKNSLLFAEGRAELARKGLETPETKDDRLNFKLRLRLIRSKDLDLGSHEVSTDYKKTFEKSVFANKVIFENTWFWWLAKIQFKVWGELGREEDYVAIHLLPQDALNLGYHAGFRPYASIGATVEVSPVTNLIPEGIRNVTVEVYIKSTILKATIEARIDGDTLAVGPCLKVRLEKPTGLDINIGCYLKWELIKPIVKPKEVVDKLCKSSNKSELNYNKGLWSDIKKSGESVGNAVVGGAEATYNSVKQNVVEPLQKHLAKACDVAYAAVDVIDYLNNYEKEHKIFKHPALWKGSEHVFYENKSCLQRPPPTTLKACNKHISRSLDVAVARNEGGSKGWVMAGWKEVPAGTCKTVADFGNFKGDIHIHGQLTGTPFSWGKGDGNFCVQKNGTFTFPNADQKPCNSSGQMKVKTSKMTLKPGPNNFTFNVEFPTVKFCNSTSLSSIYGSVGYLRGEKYVSSGWYEIARNQCTDVLLKAEGQIYGYATSDTKVMTKEWTGNGKKKLCVGGKVFKDLESSYNCKDGISKPFHLLNSTTWNLGD